MSNDYPGKVFPVTAKELGAFVAEQKALQTPGQMYNVPITKPMTDRDRLAEKLFSTTVSTYDEDDYAIDAAKSAIKHANLFFDTLENNNE